MFWSHRPSIIQELSVLKKQLHIKNWTGNIWKNITSPILYMERPHFHSTTTPASPAKVIPQRNLPLSWREGGRLP